MTVSNTIFQCTAYAVIFLMGGMTLAYPIKWFNSSDIDNELLERVGIVFISISMGIFLSEWRKKTPVFRQGMNCSATYQPKPFNAQTIHT